MSTMPMAANGREQKTNLLEPRDALAETEDAQHDIHERVDVVADTRIDDMVVIDCPDIRQSVQADDESRQQEDQAALLVLSERAAVLFKTLPAPRHDEHDDHEEKRPDNAVRQDLVGPRPCGALDSYVFLHSDCSVVDNPKHIPISIAQKSARGAENRTGLTFYCYFDGFRYGGDGIT